MGNPTFWRLRWEEKRCRLVVQVCLHLKILSVLQQRLVGCLKQIQQLLVGCFKQLRDHRGARSHPTPSSAGHPLAASAISPGGSPKPAASPLTPIFASLQPRHDAESKQVCENAELGSSSPSGEPSLLFKQNI